MAGCNGDHRSIDRRGPRMTTILKAFDLVPGWAYALALSAVLALLSVKGYQLNTERTARAQTVAAFATYRAAAEQASREAEAKNRQTETELRNAQEINAAEVAALYLDLERARAHARTASVGLQNAASAAAARARAQCANTTAADLGTPAGDALGMFAYVLGLVDERAGRLADIAEQRGIAGNACARAYDEAREALMR
jgi:Tfp pilus assembly protein PilE